MSPRASLLNTGRYKMQLSTKLATVVALATIGNCQLVKVNDFKAGPTNVGMYAYVPKSLKTPAPIVVAVHHCQGSAQQYSTESHYMPLADQHNFIVIYPNSKSPGGCFDVASTACTPPAAHSQLHRAHTSSLRYSPNCNIANWGPYSFIP